MRYSGHTVTIMYTNAVTVVSCFVILQVIAVQQGCQYSHNTSRSINDVLDGMSVWKEL